MANNIKAMPTARAVAATPSSPSVSPVPASIPTALEAALLERHEALAFARSEAARNRELTSQNERHKWREERDFEALRRIRGMLKAHEFWGGSYMGLRDPVTREEFGDSKRTPAIEIIEEYFTHLLKRIEPAQGMAARSDETLQAAQPEGQEPGPKDAPK